MKARAENAQLARLVRLEILTDMAGFCYLKNTCGDRISLVTLHTLSGHSLSILHIIINSPKGHIYYRYLATRLTVSIFTSI